MVPSRLLILVLKIVHQEFLDIDMSACVAEIEPLYISSSPEADGPREALYNAQSMRAWLRKAWPLLKAVLAVAILVAIGRQFVRDLSRPELWQRSLHPGWLVLSAAFYLLGLGFSALYWYRLLAALGQRPSLLRTLRAHYIGQMGKYLP